MLLERRRNIIARGGGAVDYSKQYLTIEMFEAGTQTFKIATDVSATNCTSVSYSLDNGSTWTTTANVDSTLVEITTPSLAIGDKVLWKATALLYAANTNDDFAKHSGFVLGSTKCDVYGNLASMIYGDSFVDNTTIPNKQNIFARFFQKNTGLTNAENLIIPFTKTGTSCYYYFFYGCTSLLTAPELPATTLVTSCYSHMFHGCEALTKPPTSIPAAAMVSYGCESMFHGCTSLTSAPTLPATTLAERCYRYMFSGTAITSAPVLPALTLSKTCYSYMFNNCTSLNYIKMMATDISAQDCLQSWVSGVSSSGTFVKNVDAEWTTTGSSGVPTNWTVETASS